ncbi:MAG: AAA family ATPase [bacterium]|nr:AAA family ATPase [bacterium]
MESFRKEQILNKAREHVSSVSEMADLEHVKTTEQLRDLVTGKHEYDEIVRARLSGMLKNRADELYHLAPSPFVARCDVSFDEKNESLYFGKFSFPKENIYSWITPAARLRFEEIGDVSYTVPSGKKRKGKLNRKDQFMISQGKINFMASESTEHERTLIHQEHLTNRKTGFVLPEIVAQMEKAQDQVIRANPEGSFLISGPAGSGKTTLALHRIAYLLQSPETLEFYKDAPMIVFVQDKSTQQYFSGLLPELGIHQVEITTYGAWAMKQLGLVGFKHDDASSFNAQDIDWKEVAFEKSRYTQGVLPPVPKGIFNPFTWLKNAYSQNPVLLEALTYQANENQLDLFDLILLQAARIAKDGLLLTETEEYRQGKNSELIRKKKIVPLQYSLVMIDEVQNYTAGQIQVIQSCLHPNTKSMLYAGDLGQRTRIGALKEWHEVGEKFTTETHAELKKVYRNTREILEYINKEGFSTEIPDGIPSGPEVIEYVHGEEAVTKVEKLISDRKEFLVGILGFETHDLKDYIHLADTNVKVTTIEKAQGVEFDTVVLVGIGDKHLAPSHTNVELENELTLINKDLYYVGLTRAMRTLVVVRAIEQF